MRILYVGQLWEGGTCRERMLALRKLGHEVTPFDTTNWTAPSSKVWAALGHRFNSGPCVSGLNSALLSITPTAPTIDLIWIDKGRWIQRATLEELKAHFRAPALHFTLDAHILANESRHFNHCLPAYDLAVTTKAFEVDPLRRLGVKDILLVLQGFDARFLEYVPSTTVAPEWASELCFIGSYTKYYQTRLDSLARSELPLRVWGPGWTRRGRSYVSGAGVWGHDYLCALSNAKIGLGLLQKGFPETSTTRTFEIPALGTLLLAERTDDHAALFSEGHEAEFFSSNDELIDKARFYLRDAAARRRIAEAGRGRCIHSDYSSEAQLRKVLAKAKSSLLAQ